MCVGRGGLPRPCSACIGSFMLLCQLCEPRTESSKDDREFSRAQTQSNSCALASMEFIRCTAEQKRQKNLTSIGIIRS